MLLKAYKAISEGRNCVFATIVESSDKGSPRKPGSKMIVFEDGSSVGTIGGGWSEESAKKACLKAIKKKKPSLESFVFDSDATSQCGGEVRVFIEPLRGMRNFILCGAGHIGLPLSLMVKMLGFELVVIDDRKEYANKKRFPHADKILVGSPGEVLQTMNLRSNDYVMVVTHAHQYDFECVEAIVETPIAYLGVISSKAKKSKMVERLKAKGISRKFISRIKSPAGIDLGAQTPEEIAVSIAAELVTIDNEAYVGSEKFKAKK